MITAKLPSLPVAASTTAPVPTPPATPATPASGRSFADRLQQARHEQPRPAEPKPRATAKEPGEPDTPATRARPPAGHANKAAAAPARGTGSARNTTTPQTAKTDPAAKERVAEESQDTQHIESLLPGWSAATPVADAAAVPAPGTALAGTAPEAGLEGVSADTGPAGEVAGNAAAGRRTGLGLDAMTDALSRGDTATGAAATTEALGKRAVPAFTEAVSSPAAAATPATTPPDPTLLLPTAPPVATITAPPGPASTPGAAAPFEARLSAALGSPDFAPALGVQVSILAREGVQQARLHLNPAEMGPIAVQIAVDGQNAQVHFQADVAATREALESSLPELAAALREGGFTLSGGGVSQQRRDSAGGPGNGTATGDRDAGRSGHAHGADDSGPAASAVARAPRRQGVVDLYA
jgi:flagellar hook-length control protein FliK